MPDTEQNIKSALDRFSFLSDVVVVGGAVRDMVIGRQSDDIDLATSDTPEEVMAKCRDRGMTVIETGVQHGTVTAVLEGGEFEITTFRRDVSTDGRNATVEWADDVEEDLARRDFTINAMAFGEDGFVDPFGGLEDIDRGKIEAVGDPRDRFREDFLRIVRAIRFAARFGFWIGEDEHEAMGELADRVVENVSVERIVMELEKAFKDDNLVRFLTDLHNLGILEDALGTDIRDMGPVFCSTLLDDHDNRMLVFLRGLERETELSFDQLQSRLRLPNGLVEDARALAEALEFLVDRGMALSDEERRRFHFRFNHVMDTVESAARWMGAAEDLFREPNIDVQPIVSGADFIDRGHEEGPVIGELVQAAHDAQLRRGETDRQTLIQEAESQV